MSAAIKLQGVDGGDAALREAYQKLSADLLSASCDLERTLDINDNSAGRVTRAMRVACASGLAAYGRAARVGCWVTVSEQDGGSGGEQQRTSRPGWSHTHPQVDWTRLFALQSALSQCTNTTPGSVIFTDSDGFLRAYAKDWDARRAERQDAGLTKHGTPLKAHTELLYAVIAQARALSGSVTVRPLKEAPDALRCLLREALWQQVRNWLRILRTGMRVVRLSPEEAQKRLQL